jgi:hypothetical protein
MKAISGCSFVVEPGDLWQRRILRRYLSVAPSVERGAAGQHFSCPALPDLSIDLAGVPWLNKPLTTDDPSQRLEEGIRLGVGTEVLFPTFAWSLYCGGDSAFEAACMVAYNIWFSSIASSSPLRFYGAAMIPAGAAGLAELERCAKLTFRTAVIAADSPEALPEELLEAAAVTGLPVVLTQRGSATPATNFQRFTRESSALAEAALHLDGKRPRMIVLSEREAATSSSDPISHVTNRRPDGKRSDSVWGHLGQPISRDFPSDASAQPFFRDNAIRLYLLPDVTDAKFGDMRRARQLAMRIS